MTELNRTPLLIVDDDPVFRESLKIVLAQKPQEWFYHEASSVHEAVAILSQYTIELAIVDINLPDGTAADVVREAVSTACLLCTQDDTEPTFKRLFADPSLSEKLVGYLTKPLQPGAIWSIRAALEIGRERQMRNRTVGDATAALEEERRQIAQNLHDAMGASLAQLTWVFSNINQVLHDATAGTNLPLVQKISAICAQGKAIVADAHKDVTQAISLLRPEAVSVAGLRAAIEYMVEQWERSAPTVKFTCEIGPDVERVDMRRAGIVYRLLQEGITNAMRHTAAVSVQVRVACNKKMLCLTVISQGKPLKEKSNYELVVLRERTSSLGGQLKFTHNAKHEEHTLVIDIPIPN